MSTIRSLSIAILAAAALGGSVHAAKVLTISEYGDDGDGVYYQVTCADGAKGSVIVRHTPPEICAQPAYRDESCRVGWDLEQAAAYSCG